MVPQTEAKNIHLALEASRRFYNCSCNNVCGGKIADWVGNAAFARAEELNQSLAWPAAECGAAVLCSSRG